jgi:hypothetical protein
MLVDSTFTDSCSAKLYRLERDISGDGWAVIRHDLSRNLGDTDIRTVISNDYAANADARAVLILGHLAVPYAGDLNPDGHPDHLGAWPADVYYGAIGGPWTDTSVNDVSAGYVANYNVPGDGKWDQTIIMSPAVLQVSRVDFYNMPLFNKTEVQMMNTYLDKDHVYKMDSLPMNRRALVNDNFGVFGGEAFAANGYRNFSSLLGRDSVQSIPFVATLNDSSYQWAYGCGGGWFQGAGGVGSTTDFTTNNVNAIFTMLFGSYFGDWNVQNNFLRSPLCANVPALTCCWAGRPNWFFHHMAMGENIGYSTALTQNNMGLYFPTNYGAQWVHVALMGDLTLRSDYIKLPSNMTISAPANHGAYISWNASPDVNVAGYYVYRSTSLFGTYNKISPMLTGLTFHDTVGTSGLVYYMVRPVKLVTNNSGSYYNLGVGITDTATVSYPNNVANVVAIESVTLYPNPVQDVMNVQVSAVSAATAQLSIIDEAGRIVFHTSKQMQQGSNTYSFNVSKLPVGSYHFVMNVSGDVRTIKWVKG